jgi:hypothetical protein
MKLVELSMTSPKVGVIAFKAFHRSAKFLIETQLAHSPKARATQVDLKIIISPPFFISACYGFGSKA